MTRQQPPPLPDDVHALLTSVNAELWQNRLSQSTLNAALAGLDRLPPAAVVRADGAIAWAAGLFHPPIHLRPGDWLYPVAEYISPDMPRLARAELLFLFHRSGWMREAALRRLEGALPGPFFVAAVAYRLNDWVSEVRQAARACVGRTFPATGPAIVAEAALFLLGRRAVWRRWQSDEAEALDAAIARPDVADWLAARMTGATTGPMASLLRQALRRPEMDRHLPSLAAGAVQPALRAAALRTLLDGEASWPDGFERRWIDKSLGQWAPATRLGRRELARQASLEALVEQAARDRSPAVRRVAADALVGHRTALANADEVIELLAADSSRAVRERIDFLRRHPAAAPAESPMADGQ